MTAEMSRAKIAQVALREKVYHLTGGRCFYCAEPVLQESIPERRDWIILRSTSRMAIEHTVPVCRGSSASDRLVPSCGSCNNRKGAFTLAEYRYIRGMQLGSLSFVFPFEDAPAACRDWLMVHSEREERDLVLRNMPSALPGYDARRSYASRRKRPTRLPLP